MRTKLRDVALKMELGVWYSEPPYEEVKLCSNLKIHAMTEVDASLDWMRFG